MSITTRYVKYSGISDEDLVAALNALDEAAISFAESGGQQTISIGGLSFTYATRAQLLAIRQELIDAHDARISGASVSCYRIKHLMQ